MAQTGKTAIKLYASNTGAAAPTAGNLANDADGVELAINAADGKLFYKDNGGVVQVLATKAGALGDLVGPASAVDSQIVLFNGTTGKLAKAATTTGVLKATSGVVAAATAGTDYAGVSNAQTFTASQRGTVTTDNDLSFDMAVTNNFKCTPTGGGTLTFTNITAGQSGFILLVNGSNYAIAAAATTKVSSSTLATISATGTYLLSYFSDGTNVYVAASGAMA